MEAYNFITFYPAEAKGGGVSEFGSLTAPGKQKLLEISVARRPNGNSMEIKKQGDN